jgi:hypothetical protein
MTTVTDQNALRGIQRRLSQLEGLARSPKTPERRELEALAVKAAGDGRVALQVYRRRAETLAAAERAYRYRQGAVHVLLASMRSKGQPVTPGPDEEVWKTWTAGPPPAGIEVGDLSLAKSYEVVLNWLCADARHDRDLAEGLFRGAAKAIALFDRIVNLMQSVMKGEDAEQRLTSGLAEAMDLGEDESLGAA